MANNKRMVLRIRVVKRAERCKAKEQESAKPLHHSEVITLTELELTIRSHSERRKDELVNARRNFNALFTSPKTTDEEVAD